MARPKSKLLFWSNESSVFYIIKTLKVEEFNFNVYYDDKMSEGMNYEGGVEAAMVGHRQVTTKWHR